MPRVIRPRLTSLLPLADVQIDVAKTVGISVLHDAGDIDSPVVVDKPAKRRAAAGSGDRVYVVVWKWTVVVTRTYRQACRRRAGW